MKEQPIVIRESWSLGEERGTGVVGCDGRMEVEGAWSEERTGRGSDGGGGLVEGEEFTTECV